jgi:hypothetical protein
MKISRRVVIILLAAILLLTGVLFGPSLQNYLLKPIATVSWILLRIFVLSIDQRFFWIVLIFIGLVFLFRLLSRIQTTLPEEESYESNDTIDAIEYWRSRFLLSNTNTSYDKSLRRELTNLLASYYASKQRSSNFEIYELLQRGQIPLPKHIHTFLFPQEPQDSRRSLKKLILSIRCTPRKYIRRWTGQEKVERYRMVNEVLSFIETSMEIKK